jgi:hypothetical protein
MERSTKIHLAVVKRVLRYLKETISFGLMYNKGNDRP